MASDLYQGVADALSEMIAAYGVTFLWKGSSYGCVLDAGTDSLVTSKALFSDGNYPTTGDVIRVADKDRQVTNIANSGAELVAGGMVESSGPFVDDPTSPSLAIGFDTFINK